MDYNEQEKTKIIRELRKELGYRGVLITAQELAIIREVILSKINMTE